MIYIFGILISFYITVALIPPLRKIATFISLVDVPDKRKIHKTEIPRVGGIGIIVGSCLTYFIWVWLTEFPVTIQIKACLSGILVLFVTGILDDFYTLNYKQKLFGQCLAATITLFVGKVFIFNMGFWISSNEVILPVYIALPLTFIFIVGITNAINLSDGLDGLAGGISIFIFSALAVISYLEGRIDLLVACLSIIGALFAFLRYNSFPANVFMGDTGSLFLGFMAAIICIALTQTQNSAVARTLPLLILGMPIIDTVFVFGYRIIAGGSPFRPDRKHIHYQFIKIGFSHAYAVLWIYFFQACMLLISINLRYYSEIWIVILFLLIFTLLILMLFVAKRSKKQFSGGPKTLSGIFSSSSNGYLHFLESFTINYIRFLMPLGLIVLSVLSPSFDRTIVYIIFAMAVISLILFFIHPLYYDYSFRLTTYILTAVLLLNTQKTFVFPVEYSLKTMHHMFWGSIACAVVVYHLLTRFRYLKDTTLDYIILFMVLVVPFFPSEIISRWNLATVVGGMLVFFWSSDLLIIKKEKKYLFLFSALCYVSILIIFFRVVFL